jgi:uncharacterized protein DUF559
MGGSRSSRRNSGAFAQLRALGVERGAVAGRVREGRLHRLHAGVYAVGHARVAWRGRMVAAVLACGPAAVLSHGSAGIWWDLLSLDAAVRIDVSVPRYRRGATGVRTHRPRSLDARDVTRHAGIPITSVARTLLDVAATVRPSHLERALAQAERLQIYDGAAIAEVLTRANGPRGAARLARATASEPAFTRSELEARFLGLIDNANLPRPRVNVPLDALDHGRIEVDFHWPRHRLIVETDGHDAHGTPSAFQSDRKRDVALTAQGFRVVRFTWHDIAGEAALVQSRHRALLEE